MKRWLCQLPVTCHSLVIIWGFIQIKSEQVKSAQTFMVYCGSYLLFVRPLPPPKKSNSVSCVAPCHCTEQLCVDSSEFKTFKYLPRSLICFIEVSVIESHTVPLVFWIICCSEILTLILIAALGWPQIPCECRWPWLLGYAYFKSRTKMKRKKKEWGKDMKAWKLH